MEKGRKALKDCELEELADSNAVNVRQAWKEHIGRILPHASRQIRNFMLAVIAEGRRDEDAEEGHKRGDAISCDLTMVRAILYPLSWF